MLMIVSDITDTEVEEHIAVTESIISDLGATDKPRIYVYNKCDATQERRYYENGNKNVFISAKCGDGIDTLLETIEETVHEGKSEYNLIIPYTEQSVLSAMYDKVTVLSVEYLDVGVSVKAILGAVEKGMYQKYIKE
jgi:GTP-binding protein HflX